MRIAGEEVPVAATPGSENRLAFTIRVPCGVVVAIAPFNAPLNTVAHKIGPALAAGNAVVLKPAAHTPLSSMALAAILLEAGLPPGYLNLVHGPGAPPWATRWSRDPRIRFFTFTGSTAVGRTIKQHSGHRQDPPGTRLEQRLDRRGRRRPRPRRRPLPRAGYRKAGQVCTSVQRCSSHARVIDELSDLLEKRVVALRPGTPETLAPG